MFKYCTLIALVTPPPSESLPPMSQKHDNLDKTRWRADKRGIRATKFPFTVEQEQVLYQYGRDLELNIDAIAKGRALKNNVHVTAWKKDKSTDIMNRSEFTTLDFSTHTEREWFSVSRPRLCIYTY